MLSLLSMGVTHESGRGDQDRSESWIETHDGRAARATTKTVKQIQSRID